jgi:hypothetical protein
MRPTQYRTNSRLVRLVFVAAFVSLIFVSPVFSFEWFGPFPQITGTQPGNVPPAGNQTIPPLFGWTDQPPATATVPDLAPPGPSTPPQSTPEPSTIIAGLIGAGALGLVRLWRQRRGRTTPFAV